MIQVNGTFTPEPQAGASKSMLNQAFRVFRGEAGATDGQLVRRLTPQYH